MTVPFIYLAIFPVFFLDIIFETYHRICFPVYKLSYIKRSQFIKIDRHKLSYLSFRDKLQCVYCGYINGVLAYAVKIAAETEKYWCAIKHAKYKDFVEPVHHKDFLEYGDEEAFRKLKKD